MILEVVTAQIKPGHEAGFEEAFQQASKLLASSKGHIDHELRRCIEVKGKYLILIRWNTVEDHLIGFRESPAFQEYRAIVSPFYESPSQMNHYEMVMQNPA